MKPDAQRLRGRSGYSLSGCSHSRADSRTNGGYGIAFARGQI